MQPFWVQLSAEFQLVFLPMLGCIPSRDSPTRQLSRGHDGYASAPVHGPHPVSWPGPGGLHRGRGAMPVRSGKNHPPAGRCRSHAWQVRNCSGWCAAVAIHSLR